LHLERLSTSLIPRVLLLDLLPWVFGDGFEDGALESLLADVVQRVGVSHPEAEGRPLWSRWRSAGGGHAQ